MILVAVTLGRWLEATGKHKASQSLQSLQQLLPDTVRRIQETGEQTVSLDEIKAGDVLRVLGGERIPVDGRLERRSAVVDEQLMTGEVKPRQKEVGEDLYGGTLNLDHELYLRATAGPTEGTIQRIIELFNALHPNSRAEN